MGVCDKIMHFVSKNYTILGGSNKNKYTFMPLDVKMHQKMKINI